MKNLSHFGHLRLAGMNILTPELPFPDPKLEGRFQSVLGADQPE